MKLNTKQIEAAAYLFERANGNHNHEYQNELIKGSGLLSYSIGEIEKLIVDGLLDNLYETEPERSSLYWALGKLYNQELIPLLQNWLKSELELGNANSVYQLMISLDNLNEQVFSKDRNGSYSSHEIELNMKDALDYIKSIN